MKIASITNTSLDPTLGSGKTVISWSEGLRQLGNQVDVYDPATYFHPWPGDIAKRLRKRIDPLKLESRLLNSDYDLIEFYGAEFGPLIRRLRKHRRGSQPFLVAHTNGLELLAAKAQKRFHMAVTRPLYRRMIAGILASGFERADKWAFNQVDAFAAICDADAQYIIENRIQPACRCVVVEPGIDSAFLNSNWLRAKHSWLLALGSWTERKDPETLMKTVRKVMEAHPTVELQFLGAGGAKEEILVHLPSEFHVRTKIHPRLSQESMVEIMTLSKIFVFPSLYEGYGMATTEAMACGCVPVVTPTGFGSSLGKSEGIVCPYRDVGSFVRAVLNLLEDDKHRERFAKEARRRVENQTWERQVSLLNEAYHSWHAAFSK